MWTRYLPFRTYHIFRWGSNILVIFKRKILLEIYSEVHTDDITSYLISSGGEEEVFRSIDMNGHVFIMVVLG